MTVQLSYNETLYGIEPAEASDLLEELNGIHGSSSSTSGQYSVTFARYQWGIDEDRESEVHFHVDLEDADDSDYPDVKDDLAETIAGLTSIDAGTKKEIEPKLTGEMYD